MKHGQQKVHVDGDCVRFLGFQNPRMVPVMLNWLVDVVDGATPAVVKRSLKRIFPGIDNRIYRFVRAVSQDRQQEVAIRRGPLRGRRFMCSMKMERNYWLGIWEADIQSFISSKLGPGDVFYDIGVHKGYFTLIAAQIVGKDGKVIGFEPNASCRDAARRNIDLNPDLSQRIELLDYAIADSAKKVKFHGAAHSTKGRIVDSDQDEDSYEVEAISIDQFVGSGNPPPTFIKMDIQGGERWALPGMTDTLKTHGPLLLVEIHDLESYRTLIDVAERTDYHVSMLDGSDPTVWDNSDKRHHEGLHYLALPAARLGRP